MSKSRKIERFREWGRAVRGGMAALGVFLSFAPVSSSLAAGETLEQLKARLEAAGSVDVPCRTGANASKNYMGNLPCDGAPPTLVSAVREMLNSRFQQEVSWFYRGKKPVWSTGEITEFQGPVCNVLADEVERNALPSGENPSCGQSCKLAVHRSITGNVSVKVLDDSEQRQCAREYAWYNGAWLQARNFYRKQVLSEWQAKHVTLSDFSGTRPSASVAASAVLIMNESNRFIDGWTRRDGEQEVSSMKCDARNGAAETACHMEALNKRLVLAWMFLLSHEINLRAQKDFLTKFSDAKSWTKAGQRKIGDRCRDECVCVVCSDEAISDCSNKCYRREIPKFVKDSFQLWDTPGDYPKPGPKPAMPTAQGSDSSTPASPPQGGDPQ